MIITYSITSIISLQRQLNENEDNKPLDPSMNKCPQSSPLFVKDKNECFIRCPTKYHYLYKTICYMNCPENTSVYKCSLIYLCYPNLSPKQIDSEFNAIINDEEAKIMFRYQYYTKWKINDYNYHIFSISDISEHNVNETMIEQINCDDQYTIYSSKTKTELIIIRKEWEDDTTPVKQIKLKLYSPFGKKLDIMVCQFIKLSIPFNSTREQDVKALNIIKELYYYDRNPFNLNDRLYTDITYKIPLKAHSDMTLRDRYDKYYEGFSWKICPMNYTVKRFDFETNKINCEYDKEKDYYKQPIKLPVDEPIWFIVKYKTFLLKGLFQDLNLILLTVVPIVTVFIILCIAFIYVGKDINMKRKKIIFNKRKDAIDYQVAEASNNNNKNNAVSKNSGMSHINMNNMANFSLKEINTISIEKSKLKYDCSIENYIDITFEEVLTSDFMSFSQRYKNFILITHSIINLLFFKSKNTPKCFFIYFFSNQILIDLSTSAICFTINDISAIYHNEGYLPFINNLRIVFMAFCLSTTLMLLLRIIFYYMLRYKEEAAKIAEQSSRVINESMEKYVLKIVIYFILQIIIIGLLSYYTLIFNAIFTKTKIHHFIVFCFLQLIHCIIPFIMCLGYAGIIALAIHCKSSCLFKTIKCYLQIYLI